MPDITIDSLSIEIDKKGQPSSDALKNLKDRLGVLDALSKSIASFGEKGLANLTSFATALNTISSALDSIDTKKLQALKNVNVKISQSRNQNQSAKSDVRSNDSIENELQKNTQPKGFTFSGIENTDEEKIRVAKTETGYSEGKTVSTQTEDISSATAKAFDGASKVDAVIANIQKKTEMLSSDLNARLARMVDEANKSFLHLGETYGNQPFMAEAIEQSRAQIEELVDNYKDKIAELKDIAPFVSAKADVMGARDSSEAFNAFKDQVDVASNDMKNMSSVDMSGMSVQFKQIVKEVKDLAIELAKANEEKLRLEASGDNHSASFLERFGKLFDSGLDTVFAWREGIGQAFKDVSEKMNPVFVGAVKVGKALGGLGGKVLKSATSGLRDFASKLQHVYKRLGQLIITRSLRKLLSEFSKAVKEGVNNLYQWSSALGGQFARSMDQASSASLYLKNSFGAMVAPIINALVPALNMVVDAIVGVMNAFNQLFALLGGQTYWTKAIKQQKDYAKATGGSTKANKDYLLSIDELNVLNDNKGGGGGGSAMDYSNMFEDVTVFDDWAKKIQEAIDNGDWYGVGEIIGKKLNEVILDIDTSTAGENLAEKINHVLDASLGFLETINTKLWGGKVSAFFNKIFEDVNFDTAGRVIAEKTNKLWQFFLGIVQTFKWDVAGEALQTGINGWISQIDPSTITSTFNTLWQGVMKVITDVATADWGALGTKVGEAINRIDWGKDLGDALTATWNLATAIGDFIFNALDAVDWEGLSYDLVDFLLSIFPKLEEGTPLGARITIWALKLSKFIVETVTGSLKAVADNAGWTWLSEKIEEDGQGAVEALDKTISAVEQAVDMSRQRTESNVNTTVDNVNAKISTVADNTAMSDMVTNDVDPALQRFVTNTGTTVQNVDGKIAVLASMNYMDQWANNDVNPTFEEVVKNAGLTEGDVNKKFSPIDSYTHFATWYENDALFNMGETVRLAEESEGNILNKLSPIASYDMYAQWYKDDVLFNMDLAETLAETGYKNISDSLSPIKDFDMWRQWKQNDFDPVFGDLTYDKMKSKGESIASGISAGIKSIPLPTLDITTATKGVTVGVKQQLLSIPSFSWRAGGGFPDQGEMFIARENGAEMVGRIGNKTAVANNDQIVDAIAYGVYQAVTEAGGMGGGAQTINVVAELDGQKMYESNKTVGRDRGYDLGMGAFGYVNNI